MKHVILLCDGMADEPHEALGGHTPMEVAHKPQMDALAAVSEVGTVKTVPDALSPGSDVANLSVMGYDTALCYTGRSPLEAANIGIDLSDTDVAFRCNLVTLSEEPVYADKSMVDYCADDISTAEADELIRTVQEAFGGGEFDFYTGTNYRHCLVWHGGKDEVGKLTPPHDITGQPVAAHLPTHPDTGVLLAMMEKSYDLLKDHPVNAARKERGLRPANSIWLWGQGKRPQLEDFTEKNGIKGSVISAVDLLKGIGRIAHMHVYNVPGATGYIDTNYSGKTNAAIAELTTGQDLVYIHFEGPDECGHRGEAQNKVKAIEDIDRLCLEPLLKYLRTAKDFDLLILPDHPTPLRTRTHDRAPVPYLLYRSYAEQPGGPDRFTEASARETGVFRPVGHTLLDHLLGKD